MQSNVGRKPKQASVQVDEISQVLVASSNLCDQRKGRDIRQLDALSRHAWRGRFQILHFNTAPERSLVLVSRLQVPGYVWDGKEAVVRKEFILALSIGNNYPLSMPLASFIKPIPFHAHVVDRRFIPENLPAELHEYIRQGHDGGCCYLRASQWTRDVNLSSLAIVFWQISRLLTGTFWGELASLNPAARDLMQRKAGDGVLCLGAPLPYPGTDDTHANVEAVTRALDDDDDIEWTVD